MWLCFLVIAFQVANTDVPHNVYYELFRGYVATAFVSALVEALPSPTVDHSPYYIFFYKFLAGLMWRLKTVKQAPETK